MPNEEADARGMQRGCRQVAATLARRRPAGVRCRRDRRQGLRRSDVGATDGERHLGQDAISRTKTRGPRRRARPGVQRTMRPRPGARWRAGWRVGVRDDGNRAPRTKTGHNPPSQTSAKPGSQTTECSAAV